MTVKPAEIDDSVPTEDEIAEAVTKLWRNRSGGPSRIHAEYLKGWLAAAKRGGLAEEKGKENTEAEEEGEEMWGKRRDRSRSGRRGACYRRKATAQRRGIVC